MEAIKQMEIRKRIRDFITETFLVGGNIETVNDNDSFMQKEIIDSTGVLELTTFVEKEFGISIEDNELVPVNLDSIDNLVNFIGRKTQS